MNYPLRLAETIRIHHSRWDLSSVMNRCMLLQYACRNVFNMKDVPLKYGLWAVWCYLHNEKLFEDVGKDI